MNFGQEATGIATSDGNEIYYASKITVNKEQPKPVRSRYENRKK